MVIFNSKVMAALNKTFLACTDTESLKSLDGIFRARNTYQFACQNGETQAC